MNTTLNKEIDYLNKKIYVYSMQGAGSTDGLAEVDNDTSLDTAVTAGILEKYFGTETEDL
jgi:hypothetical protein